jgi:hypothetical protein
MACDCCRISVALLIASSDHETVLNILLASCECDFRHSSYIYTDDILVEQSPYWL